jgi:F0F1-type ATP synthase assembly protein I
MTSRSGSDHDQRPFTDEELAAIGDHVAELKPWLTGERLLRRFLIIGFGLGLGAHIGVYPLQAFATTEPFLLIADLLYGLGLSMWTGIVVVLFVQVFPQTTRRDLESLINAYEASKRSEQGH